MGGQCPDLHFLFSDFDTGELVDMPDVHQQAGLCHTQFHGRDETMPTGQQLGAFILIEHFCGIRHRQWRDSNLHLQST